MIKKLLAPLALVLVVAACTQPAPADLQVTALSPAPNATGVPVDTDVSATFNVQVVMSSVTGNFELTAEGGAPVEGEISYDPATRTATFTPSEDLAYSTVYTASVEGVYTSRGASLTGTASWSFTTEADPDGPDPEVISVTIDQDDQTLTVGGGVALSATVEVVGSASQAVVWSSSAPEFASVNATTGLVSAVAVGVATVTATSVDDASMSDSVTITVEAGEPDPEVLLITLDPSEDADLFIGEELVLTYEISVVGGASTTINWTVVGDVGAVSLSSDETSDATGTVTVTGVLAGVATVVATSDEDGDISASIEITVPEQTVTGTIEPSDASIIVGGSVTLTADIDAQGGADPTYVWSSSDPLIASVDEETGEVTGESVGSVTISLISNFDDSVLDFIEVEVSVVNSVEIDGEDVLHLLDGTEGTLTATVDVDGNGSTAVLWSSDSPEVVEIDEETGELTVVATSDDPVTITATSVLDPDQSDSITVYSVVALLSVDGDYADYVDLADINTEIDIAFPTITGAVGDLTFTVLSGALPVDFVTVSGLIDPLPVETYSVTLDADTGAISGQTGFPGVFTGTVQVEDSIGQTATADFSLELGVSLFYADGLGDPPNVYTHATGAPPVGGEIVVAGDLVQLSGVANTDFLPLGFIENFEFDLVYVTSVGPEVPGMFDINEGQGAIVRLGGSVGTSYHEYMVVLTYDDGEYDEVVEYDIRFRRLADAPFPDEGPLP